MQQELCQDNQFEIVNGRRVLKKHVATIHCTNKLSLLERKISNALLFHAQPTLKDSLIHEISLDQLKNLLNCHTRNHKALKDALRKLISTVIEWNILGDDVPELDMEGWNASTILSSVSVKDGVVKYQYSELIKSLIIEPKIYGKVNLIIQARFKSAYALALYENCARYRGLLYTKSFPMEQFRKLMGVEDGKYEVFRDFNRRVLMCAVNEINTCSDIRITPEIKRKGRKVESIKFRLDERNIKKRIKFISNDEIVESDIVYAEVKQWGVKKNQYQNWLKEYGRENILKQVNYVKNTKEYQRNSIDNLGGYLSAALKNDFMAINNHKPIQTFSEHEKKKTEKQEQKSQLENDIWEKFSKLDEAEKQKIAQSCLNSHSNSISSQLLIDLYNKRGVCAIKREIVEFLL